MNKTLNIAIAATFLSLSALASPAFAQAGGSGGGNGGGGGDGGGGVELSDPNVQNNSNSTHVTPRTPKVRGSISADKCNWFNTGGDTVALDGTLVASSPYCQ